MLLVKPGILIGKGMIVRSLLFGTIRLGTTAIMSVNRNMSGITKKLLTEYRHVA